jgi:hypothetical protein
MTFVFRSAMLLGVALSAIWSTPSMAGACDGFEAPSVVVNSPPQPTVVDRSKSAAELTNLMGPNESLELSGFVTLGVTSVDYSTSVKSSVQIKKSRFGNWCAYPVNIVVNHGFSKPLTVYIANELREGTCKYDKTHEHEFRHVRYHEEGIWRASIEIDKAITATVRSGFPVSGNSSVEVSDAVTELISKAVSEAVKDVAASVRASNDAMDTPDAYRIFSNLCK